MIFSQRKGLTKIKDLIQKDSMDDELRTSLWNVLYANYWGDAIKTNDFRIFDILMRRIWVEYYKMPADELPPDINEYNFTKPYETVRKNFYRCEWFKVYDFLEFIVNCYDEIEHLNSTVINACNIMLERELSAYRFVGKKIKPITDDQEIETIEKALISVSEMTPVREHLQCSINHLSDKKKH